MRTICKQVLHISSSIQQSNVYDDLTSGLPSLQVEAAPLQKIVWQRPKNMANTQLLIFHITRRILNECIPGSCKKEKRRTNSPLGCTLGDRTGKKTARELLPFDSH